MLFKTRGIPLGYIKYKETSIIAKIYTEEFGLQSYIQNGVRSSSNKNTKIALFQPLTLLDMVVYHKKGVDLHRISEMKTSYTYKALHTDIRKLTIGSFLTEILIKCLKDETKNEELFGFLFASFVALDHLHSNDFHLKCMIRLGQYLGFMPKDADGLLLQLNFLSPNFIQKISEIECKKWLHHLFESDFEVSYPNAHAYIPQTIDVLVEYYAHHVPGFGNLRSLEIIRSI